MRCFVGEFSFLESEFSELKEFTELRIEYNSENSDSKKRTSKN